MFNFLFKKLVPEPEYDEESKVFQLVQKIFERAQQEGSHEILFGVPPGETAVDLSEANAEEFDENLQELNQFAKEQGLDIKIPERVEVSSIPIWMKIEEEWYQVFEVPTCLLHECIRAIHFFSDPFSLNTINVKYPLEDKTAYANLDLNENFNYHLTDVQIK